MYICTRQPYPVVLLSAQNRHVKTPGSFGAAELKLARKAEKESSFESNKTKLLDMIDVYVGQTTPYISGRDYSVFLDVL